ncbi:MAG: hypothetical protein AB1384_12760 [Actinomycetota bacterium]
MNGNFKHAAILLMSLVLLLVLGAALLAGCGGGSGDFTNAVLSEWEKLEDGADELVQAADEVDGEADLASLSGLFSENLDTIAAFEDALDGLKVPAGEEESTEALEDFLSSYDEYLGATADIIDEVMGGAIDLEVPDFEALADDAQGALDDYQDSQDYNPARLDSGVWDLGDTVSAVLFALYGGEDPDDPKFNQPLQALDDYYIYFNEGDGESMYLMLDFSSPIMVELSEESFLVQVGEAHDAGIQAVGDVQGVESRTDEEGDWVTVYMTVDYTEYQDMEGNTVPAHSEDVIVELIESRGEWYIYDVHSESGIW